MKNLKEDLKGSSISIYDSLIKRFYIMKDDTRIKVLITKLLNLKDKIIHNNNNTTNHSTQWLCLRVMDNVSLDIYNEAKINSLFFGLSDFFKIFEDSVEKKKEENIVLTFFGF